jgi:hypothetical protein
MAGLVVIIIVAEMHNRQALDSKCSQTHCSFAVAICAYAPALMISMHQIIDDENDCRK